MGFEDFDQMDTWDAGKTAGGRHGNGASKKRMSKNWDKMNKGGLFTKLPAHKTTMEIKPEGGENLKISKEK
jgi:hypothetical protein